MPGTSGRVLVLAERPSPVSCLNSVLTNSFNEEDESRYQYRSGGIDSRRKPARLGVFDGIHVSLDTWRASMFSRRAVVLLVTSLAVLLASPAQAITGGTADDPDNPTYPNVGAVVAIYAPISEEDPIIWCSGTLVAPTLFLTAAHCVQEDSDLEILGVTFDAEPADEEGTVVSDYISVAKADLHPHPGYPGPASDPLDIAIIVLADNDVTPDLPLASLPTLRQFDAMAKTALQAQRFTAVGYGSSGRLHEPGEGSPEFVFPDVRMYAVSSFLALNRAWLRLSMNPALDDGGTCYGDSGGPNFLGTGGDATDIIAAITVTGDTPCRATNVVYRLDSLSAQEFLFAEGVITTDPSPEESAPAAKTKAEKGKANKGKAKKAGKDRDGKKRHGHRR
jgi:hypothetical protein